MKLFEYIIKFSGLLLCIFLLKTGVAQAGTDPCRAEAKDANDAAQQYRAAARDVGHSCTMENGECAGAESEADAALENLIIAHQTMLLTCPTGGPPPPPPPPPSPNITGDLVITEFMANPSCAGGEWFEVHNPTNGAFELQNLVIQDDGTEIFTINQSVIIPAGGFKLFVLDAGESCVLSAGVIDPYRYSGFTLNNSGFDAISIRNGTTVIDSVVYNSFDGWPLVPGESASLNPDFFSASANDMAANWCLSSSGYGTFGETGTPGNMNDLACITPPPPAICPCANDLQNVGWAEAEFPSIQCLDGAYEEERLLSQEGPDFRLTFNVQLLGGNDPGVAQCQVFVGSHGSDGSVGSGWRSISTNEEVSACLQSFTSPNEAGACL
jgi:hypothetical protein